MKKNLTGIIILLTITAVVVFFIFRPFLVNPNSYLFSKSGEAIKSYYNFSYQLKNGEGLINKGMNYPYGEHIQMDHSHPFHLWFFNLVDKVIPIKKHGVGLINLSLLLSLFLTLPFLFLILRRYKLPVWYSVIITLIILFLSPQLVRFKGHLELAYLFIVPMWWFLLLKFRERKNEWFWGGLLFFSAVAAGFVSQWYVTIFAFFLIGIILADFWIHRKSIDQQFRPGLQMFVLAVLPLLIVRLVLSLTDVFSDRPANPIGFYEDNANIFSVFTPFDSLIAVLSKYAYSFLSIQLEGKANIGFGAIVVAVVMVCLFLYRFYTRKNIAALFPDMELNPYLISATLLLLFAMNFPFTIGFGFLTELFPALKLMIAPGRFAWVFYYVFTVYAAVELFGYYTKLRNEGRMKRSVWVMSVVLVFWGYDAVANVVTSFSKLQNRNDRLESDGSAFMKRFEDMGRNPNDFQAIMSLPFSNSASDKMVFERGYDALSEAMKLSYHSGLPIIESLSPRQSVGQSLSAIQLLADSCIRKTRFDDMNEKPILLLVLNGDFSEQEEWLINRSDSVWGDQWVTLRSIKPAVFARGYQNWLTWAEAEKNRWVGDGNMKSDTLLSTIFFLNLDNFQSRLTFSGSGALYKKKGMVEIFQEDFPSKGLTGEYELSFWMYFDTRSAEMPEVTLNEIDRYDFPINPIKLNTIEENNVFGNWVRVDQRVTIKPGMKYQLVANGSHITIDNLQLVPAGKHLYIKSDNGKELFDNFVYSGGKE